MVGVVGTLAAVPGGPGPCLHPHPLLPWALSSFLTHFLDTEAVDKGGSVGRNRAEWIPRGQGTAGGHARAAPGHPRGPQQVPVLEPAPTSTTASYVPSLTPNA